jgi:hypothetical protein
MVHYQIIGLAAIGSNLNKSIMFLSYHELLCPDFNFDAIGLDPWQSHHFNL